MTNNPNRILRPKHTCDKVGMKPTWLWENVKNGTFPKPIPLGARAVGFLESEIDQWIADRVKSSRGEGKNNAA